MSDAERVLQLSLISHTNAGKTTLARTLLRRDVGEVLDQAHVTETSERFVMLELPARDASDPGGRIMLWDTPGFGDSTTLLRELEGRDDPLGWLAEQSFDRVEQLPLYSSQQAVLNVVEHADVVLYLVNASEEPGMAGYVEPEMQILGWIDRPVIVVLNQTGAPSNSDGRGKAEQRWRWHLASHAAVRDVISLDAFTRCWVQEGLLLLRLQALVPELHQGLMTRLLEQWRDENLETLTASARTLAELLWKAARDSEPAAEGWIARVGQRGPTRALAARLAAATRAASDQLIAAHRLEGDSAAWARGALEDVSVPGQRPDPRRAGVVGGVVGGLMGGLAADLASAGLSLGGGAIAGAILGGLGLGGLAWAYEQLGSGATPRVVWSKEFLQRFNQECLLRYLAVAHFGRGSGPWQERQTPEIWTPLVEAVSQRHAGSLARCVASARGSTDAELPPELVSSLDQALRDCLMDLYPGTERFLGS